MRFFFLFYLMFFSETFMELDSSRRVPNAYRLLWLQGGRRDGGGGDSASGAE